VSCIRIGMVMDYAGGFDESVEPLKAYEQAGLELVAVAEGYSFEVRPRRCSRPLIEARADRSLRRAGAAIAAGRANLPQDLRLGIA
jgi:hypothetical protein